jgi:hypothetical protein
VSSDNRREPLHSFPTRSDHVPGLMLEQLVGIRALLGTIFTLQVELLAHLTASDPDVITSEYVQKMQDLSLKYSREAEDSAKQQPPIPGSAAGE